MKDALKAMLFMSMAFVLLSMPEYSHVVASILVGLGVYHVLFSIIPQDMETSIEETPETPEFYSQRRDYRCSQLDALDIPGTVKPPRS
jgi:hypothetical protein